MERVDGIVRRLVVTVVQRLGGLVACGEKLAQCPAKQIGGQEKIT